MPYKLCSHCLIAQLPEAFHACTRSSDGRQARCKACAKESYKLWALQNPFHLAHYEKSRRRKKAKVCKAWSLTHHAHQLSLMAQWRLDHPDYFKLWHSNNR